MGQTRDDAAGEAFDKAARVLGLPYPGGVYIDQIAQKGDPKSVPFPHPHLSTPYDFSFSGLKTAVINFVHNKQQKGEAFRKEDVAASFQDTVADILSSTLLRAARDYQLTTLVLAGGVSANSSLRHKVEQLCQQHQYRLFMPPLSLCGDNAAMIAAQGFYEYQVGHWAKTDLNAQASLSIEKDFPNLSCNTHRNCV